MTDKSAVFQLMGETTASIFPLARHLMQPLFEEKFTEQRFYGPIFLAYNRAPEPISQDLLFRRNPYANPESVAELLEGAAEAGYIKSDGAGGFQIAKRGSAAIEAVHDVFYSYINQVNQFSASKLNELIALLAKLVDSVYRTDLTGGKLCFDLSYQSHIKVDPGSLGHVDQLLDDLNAFRDDAHVAAWRPFGVDGHTWEVLTLVWNGEAKTAEKLVERLPYRQYTKSDYQVTLEDLVQKGWIEEGSDGYRITDEGKKIRDQAELDTDANYFGPWKALMDEEINRVGELLSELRDINLKLGQELNAEQ